ncbi:T9SS type A sorting domain-containing protein [Flaviaesturariibacter flavus]|uniref:T9SS type A sorting domain-containing protein n=1 Tax=Flaviaesturariibacter flavus TaxID=2502780 RepID=A0A4R1BK51_9BACT|nr:T9SS type A sorting domain-containing protein [Flaviaesturariibacter flavus]TCJ17750.1 T9SS type A sorting domain-containing protein [Flaviaesturariibacter flavus]
MKKLYFLLCLVLTTLASFGQLVYEPFNYTPSATVGLHEASGGVWQKLNSGDSILTISGSLNYSALAASSANRVKFDGSGTDYFRQFGTQSTGTVYASFLLNITSLGSLNSTTGGYFAAFTEGTTSTTIGASVWAKASGTTQYNLGISTRSSSTTSFSTANLDLNTTYLVVIAYQMNSGTQNDVAMLWINPTSLGATAPPADVTAASPTGATADLANVGRFQLRQDNATNTPFVEFDELRIGLDYASVTPAAPAGTATLSASALAAFGNVCVNTTSGPNSFTISGSNLSTAAVTVGPLAGYSFSTTSGGTYTPSLSITQPGGTFSQTVYVNFTPTAAQSYNGNIPVGGGGATAIDVAASGTGIAASVPTVATAAPSGTTTSGTTLNGTLSATGCSAVTSYGFIYSTTSGFNPATQGTTVTSTNLAGTTFSAPVAGLTPNTTYYYVAFATNGTGTAYSTQAQFTTVALPAPSAPVAIAATNITGNSFTANWNAATGTTTGYFLDVYTQAPGTVVGGSIAGWDIPTANDAGRLASSGNTANVNVRELVAVNGAATVSYSYPTGPSGGQSPLAVSTTGWDAGVDTKYWMVEVNTTGVSNLKLSSLQASSNTGPRDWKIQYRVGNSGTWNDVTGGAVAITTSTSVSPVQYYGPSNLALPAAVDNQALVQIRWVVNSTTAVNNTTVASGGTSRITSIYIKGDYAGTVNTYVLQNQNVGNVTSYNVTGLAPNTTYYYVVRADNGGSTSANSNEISVTTAAATPPAFSAGTLAPFGSVCVGDTSLPRSFTLSGSNLTNANITVGPLANYSFALSASGPWQSTLTIAQPGGSYNAPVWVRFVPTASQAYNGNISVSGGGVTTAAQVAASGTGVIFAVTTGTASGVTTSSATLNGTVNFNGCSVANDGGFKYSTTPGFDPATSGTNVVSSSPAGGSFSSSISGLAANTTYYFVAYVTRFGSVSPVTVYGAQQSFTTTNNPTVSAGTLAPFGGVCINTTAPTGSFTVSGSNLVSNLTVNALPGYAYSTSATGPFTATLNLPVVANSVNTTVFVQFTPTAVQSYDGNIQITGGGLAGPVNVPATGFGTNNAPSVTTGTATVGGSTTATVGGSITATGCTAISGYGIKYSTTSGFNPATTGTQVAGSNLAAGSFTVPVTGLTPGTTYYYVVYATNAGGTTYGTQQSFTTPSPAITASTLTGFGNQCLNTASSAQSFTITGTNLTAADVTVGPLAGYTFSTTSGGTYTNSLTLTQPGGSFSQQVFVKLTPTAVQSYSGNIPVSGGGVSTTVNVAATGAGINTLLTVTTAAATGVTGNGATIPGTISSNGCSAPTAYGVIWSTTTGFNPASTGTNVAGTGITGGNFSVNLSGLTSGVTYYYVTYATNAGGTAYSSQGSFTTTSAAIPVAPLATAATNITSNSFTANWNAVAGATGYFLDVYTLGAGTGTTTIAGWDMATNTAAAQTANQGNANNINIQTLTPNGSVLASTPYPSGFSGTSGTPNPYAVAASGWDAGVGTKYWQITLNTTGATGLSLSFNQGSSASGPKDFKLQYRVGASGTWTDIPSGVIAMPGVAAAPANPATWTVVNNLPLPVAMENQANVAIRWLLNSDIRNDGATGVANTGTNRLSGIYVKSTSGAAVPVYVTGYQNLNVNNVTSFNVTGLAPNTTYYYVVRATNSAGTSPNSNEITVTTLAGPSLTATALTAFGNLCPNTTSAANSFAINGTNLSNANITVGPLAGYAFSTTAGGTYTPTLTLIQAGGTYSQTVFVQLTPTAVQSYNGNIPVSGGGVATAINVAASGAGVNNPPTVTTGAASAVTNVSATLAGSITATGCSPVTQYGFEWSTTAGFANGTGTQLLSTNLAGTGFTANLAGLTGGTTYYYKAFATNGGGTSYGAEQSFATAAAPVVSLTASPVGTFSGVCVNTTAIDSFTVTGVNLTTANVTLAAPAGFALSTSRTGPFASTLSLTQPGGAYSQKVYVQFAPAATQTYSGFIQLSGGGFGATNNITVAGSSIATPPVATTGDSTNIRFDGVTLRGSFGAAGCSAVTQYGIEYSGVPNFAPGSGTQVPATANTSGSFAVTLNNLVPGTTYYYRAYARNAGAFGAGAVKSVTLPGLQAGLAVFPQPVAGGNTLRVTLNGIQPGNYGIRLYSSAGEEVYRRFVNIQAYFINEQLQVPASLPAGVYVLRVTSNTSVVAHRTIIVVH